MARGIRDGGRPKGVIALTQGALALAMFLMLVALPAGLAQAQCVPSDDAGSGCPLPEDQQVIGTVPAQGAHLWTLIAPGDGTVQFTATIGTGERFYVYGPDQQLIGQVTATNPGEYTLQAPAAIGDQF